MAEQVTLLRVVVVFPSDVALERGAVSGIVDKINRDAAHPSGLHLDLWAWDTDASPTFHLRGPQGAIDEVLQIENCDLIIGIFCHRLGTPTANGKTGTEHEILSAYESFKKHGRPEIKVYFRKKMYDPESKDDLKQHGKLLTFRNRFPSQGLWWVCKSKPEFEKAVEQHLRAFVRKKSEELFSYRDHRGWPDLPTKTLNQAQGNSGEVLNLGGLSRERAKELVKRPQFCELLTTLGEPMTLCVIAHWLNKELEEAERIISGCGFNEAKRAHLSKVAKEAITYSNIVSG
jgi:hypothetical protein